MQIIGYARVSTVEQNLDLQLIALDAAGCDAIYKDARVSGATRDRDGLAQALAELGPGDQFVTWRLDRLGRSIQHLIEVISHINEIGAEFKSLTEAIDTFSSGGRLVFHIFASMTEFERALISERTKAGQTAAKKRGKHIGRRRKLSGPQIDHANVMIGTRQQSVALMAELLKVDRSTLSRALQKQLPF